MGTTGVAYTLDTSGTSVSDIASSDLRALAKLVVVILSINNLWAMGETFSRDKNSF